jgi:hypothetical protein
MSNQYKLAIAKPDLPEASIRHQSGMSTFCRGVAIIRSALKEPASPRAYPCFGKVFRTLYFYQVMKKRHGSVYIAH